MTAKWKNDKLNHSSLVDKLRLAGSINPEGQAVFKGAEVEIWLELLAAAIDFHESFPRELVYRTVLNAALSAFKEGKLSVDGLLSAVQNEERNYLRKPNLEFIVVTRISLKLDKKVIIRRIGGNSVVFRRNIPRNINVGWDKADALRVGVVLPPDDYAWAISYVRARTQWEAYRAGIDSINLIRAVWNYSMNRRRYSRVVIGPQKPINRIVCGSVVTVHDRSGEKAYSGFWHDKAVDYLQPPATFEFPSTPKMIDEERKLRKKLALSKHKRIVEQFLIEYTRACDLTDKNNAFLELWRLLEKLTDSRYKGFDVTIRRAARFYRSYEYRSLVLNIIRRIRNEAVHVGTDHDIIDAHIYELKCTVEDILARLIRNPFQFKSFGEWATFLDLPGDPNVLRDQLRMRKYALKWSR